MGLKRTSTAPSTSATSFRTHHGKVALPLCRSTCGGLGADGSGSTVHRGAPLPVMPHVQPSGGAPARSWSKPIVSASAPISSSCMAVLLGGANLAEGEEQHQV